MHTFANFTMQLEMLQNRIDYAEENSDYSNKKFAVNSNPKSKFAKKYFDLRTVTLQIKEAKMRFYFHFISKIRQLKFLECKKCSENGSIEKFFEGGSFQLEFQRPLQLM